MQITHTHTQGVVLLLADNLFWFGDLRHTTSCCAAQPLCCARLLLSMSWRNNKFPSENPPSGSFKTTTGCAPASGSKPSPNVQPSTPPTHTHCEGIPKLDQKWVLQTSASIYALTRHPGLPGYVCMHKPLLLASTSTNRRQPPNRVLAINLVYTRKMSRSTATSSRMPCYITSHTVSCSHAPSASTSLHIGKADLDESKSMPCHISDVLDNNTHPSCRHTHVAHSHNLQLCARWRYVDR